MEKRCTCDDQTSRLTDGHNHGSECVMAYIRQQQLRQQP